MVNDFLRNVIIFSFDNGSSAHSDNGKNSFLVLGEVPTDGVNDSIGTAEQKFSFNFKERQTKKDKVKRKTKFCLSLHYDDNSCLLTRENL